MDMTVRVGMTMGDRDQQVQHAMALGQAQQQAAMLGFVSPENFKNTAELMLTGMGLKGVQRFFTFPQGQQGAQPVQIPQHGAANKIDPQTQIAIATKVQQIKTEGAKEIAAIGAQAKAATTQHQNEVEAQRDTQSNTQQMQLDAFQAHLSRMTAEEVAHINAFAKIVTAMVGAKNQTSTGTAEAAHEESAESAAA